jgi:murein DD-endopeptidase MepM/ murein hydrolase activator NlpD
MHVRNIEKRIVAPILLLLMVAVFAGMVHTVGAQESVDDLRQKIEEGQQELKKIEQEIKKYEAQLNEVGAEKETLKNAIRELDLSRDKVKASIRATEKRISSTDLEIEELNREIYIKELEIDKNKEAVAQSFRKVDQIESDTLIEILLGHDSMSEVWDALEEQALLQESLRESTRILNALKTEYEKAKGKSLEKKGELVELTNELSGEEQTLAHTIYQKDELLDQTENEEANYQKLLADKKAARDQYLKEMREYEAKLQFILDPNSIPAAGSGVLKWPFEPGYILNCPNYTSALGNEFCITQYFGNTAFAQSGAYNGQGHNGVDFRAPIGTKITAPLSGTVTATGNTDAVNGCYSYGKWVLLRHDNGLSSLYAHLSSISVSRGQSVSTGQLIGYSGNTGYSTGPHLHFSVYATEGVKVQKLSDIPGRPITACSSVSIPVAAFEAYLNPLNYL